MQREHPRRKILEHCSLCHEQALGHISDNSITAGLIKEAQFQAFKASEEECAACREDVIESLSDKSSPSQPIRLSPKTAPHYAVSRMLLDGTGPMVPVRYTASKENRPLLTASLSTHTRCWSWMTTSVQEISSKCLLQAYILRIHGFKNQGFAIRLRITMTQRIG